MEQYSAELEQTLKQVVNGPNTEAIKAASDKLRLVYYKQPQVVPALVHILQRHPEQQLRQIAGVEVRKVLDRFWRAETGGLDDSTMSEIKNTLMQTTIAEQSDLVRHTSARVIAAIAVIELNENSWPELLPTLIATAQSQSSKEREVAVYILYTLLEPADGPSDGLISSVADLMQVLGQTVKDPESLQVRVSSVLALGKLIEILSALENAAAAQPVIPSIVEVLGQTVAADDEKSALQVFEVLTDLVLDEPAVLGDFFGNLVEHMITQYGVRPDVDDEFRNSALRFVFNAVRFRAKKIQSLRYGPILTQACVQILAEPLDDDDVDLEEDETTPSRLAVRIIDILSSLLPPSQVVGPVIKLMPELVNGNQFQARAAYLALAFTIEGAPDFVGNEFEQILPMIVHGLNHESDLVKNAALHCLTMFAVELPAVVGTAHETLLPLVFNIMDGSTTIKMARSASAALDSLLETLDRKVISDLYLSALVPKLLSLAHHHDDLKLKGSTVNALGSAAFAAGRNYLPYFHDTVQVIQQFIIVPASSEQAEDDIVKLSSLTVDTLGSLCLAVGKEEFAPVLDSAMNTVFQFLSVEIPDLRESAHIFIGTAAKVFQQDFAPYVDRLIPSFFQTFAQEEYEVADDFNDDEDAVGVNDDPEDLMDSIKVNSGVAVEKEFAIGGLVEIIVNASGETLTKYLSQSLEELVKLLDHFYEDIRRAAITGIWRILTTFYTQENGSANWKPGFPVESNMGNIVRSIAENAWSSTIELLKVEDDAGVVSTVFDSITTGLRECGPALILSEEHLSEIVSVIMEVLSKTHRSQTGDDEDDIPEDAKFEEEEVSESDEAMVDLAIDLIVQIAAVTGDKFTAIFPTIAGLLAKYVTSKNPSERTSGVGAFAELVNAMESNVTPYTRDLLQTFVAGLDDKKLAVRSVAAYGVGVLSYHSNDTDIVKASYPTVLVKLQGLLKKVDKNEKRRARTGADEEEDHNDQRSLANACGCIARMTFKYPESVPLDQIIPALLARLPLYDAFEENDPIFALLWKLVEEKNPVIFASSQELLRFLVEVYTQQAESDQQNALKSIGEPQSGSQLHAPETREFANKIVKAISENQPDLLTSYPVLAAANQ